MLAPICKRQVFVDDHLATCRCRKKAAVGDRLTVDDELHRLCRKRDYTALFGI